MGYKNSTFELNIIDKLQKRRNTNVKQENVSSDQDTTVYGASASKYLLQYLICEQRI